MWVRKERLLAVIVTCLLDTARSRLISTAYMDAAGQCNRQVIRNDQVEKGDYYHVVSDIWKGEASPSVRLLARCSRAFNFGDRAAIIQVDDWQCERGLEEPLLEIYDNCEAARGRLLAMLNCSVTVDVSTKPLVIHSGSSCLSLYNRRGRTRKGYYFELRVIAGKEFIPFPLGGIAGIFVACVVIFLVITKIVCVLTGYEQRLPNINYDFIDDHKMVVQGAGLPTNRTSFSQNTDTNKGSECAAPTDRSPLQSTSSGAHCLQQHQEDQRRHTLLHLTHSLTSAASSGGQPSLPGDALSDLEVLEYLDVPLELPSTPKLKRYPSAKASRMWRPRS